MSDRPFIPVARPCVGDDEVAAVAEVVRSGQYVSGRRVKEFEAAFARYVGVDHAVAVSTGTAALFIALESLGVGQGDEVIVPPMTFFATVSSVLYVGATPVFADIDPTDLCLSPESAAERITERTKAIIPVHLFGAAARMDAFQDLANRHGLLLIEDCAQAHGTMYKGGMVGGFGDAGAFSFFATKHMTTSEGGIITTNNGDAAETCRVIRNHGMTDRDTHVRLGYNNRMTELQAALGLVQLKRLDDLNAKRIANSRALVSRLETLPWAMVPVPGEDVLHTFFWCPVMVSPESDRTIEDLKNHLTANGIGFRHRYAEPLYRQPVLASRGLDYSNVYLENVERLAGQVVGLPNHPGLTREELERICEVLEAF